MADTYTPILGMTLPEIGASRDTWGAKVSGNFSALDSFVGYGQPIGMIVDFAGPTPPHAWLVCDGRAISRTTYSALFAVLGTYWGAGDGSTTFNLPNLNGRSTVGPGSMTDQASASYSFTFAASQGYVANTIAQTHLPNYNLITDTQGYHNHTGATAPGGNHTHSTDTQGYHNHAGWTQGGYAQLSVSDPGHAHGYYSFNFVSGTTISGGYGYDASWTWQNTGSSGTGISVSDTGHYHGIYYDGSHAHNISYSGNLTLGIYGDGNHQHNVALNGGGTAFTVLGPILVVTKIIYAGQQAFAAVMAGPSGAAMTIDGTFEDMDTLRAEVAELREMLRELLPRRRALSSPMRGPH